MQQIPSTVRQIPPTVHCVLAGGIECTIDEIVCPLGGIECTLGESGPGYWARTGMAPVPTVGPTSFQYWSGSPLVLPRRRIPRASAA